MEAAYLVAVASWCSALRGLVQSSADEEIAAILEGDPGGTCKRLRQRLQLAAGLEGQSGGGDAAARAALRAAAAAGDPVARIAAKDEALLVLECILEDCKARAAGRQPQRGLTLVQQLEVMASNLKLAAAALAASSEQSSAQAAPEDEEEETDQLCGWGEQLCSTGQIVLEDKHRIKSVACSGPRGLYVTFAGDVFSIGDNGTGAPPEFALSGLEDVTTPKVVGELVLERVLLGRKVVLVACGHEHSCALTQGGRLWSWGCGLHGRLGHGAEQDEPAPRLCEALLGCHVRAVACGGAHTVAVVSPSRVFSWGLGRYGRLGLCDDERSHALPQLVGVSALSAALTDAFHALFGQRVPRPVQDALDEPVVSVACGWAFTMLLGANGTVRAFGAGRDGQLGVLPAQDRHAPTVVPGLSGLGVVQISCGYHHAVAVTAGGAVWSFGLGAEGQLGLGSGCTLSKVPQRVRMREQEQHEHGGVRALLLPDESARPLKAVCAVAGHFHTLCAVEDGSLWGWGSNSHKAVDPWCGDDKHIWWGPHRISSSTVDPSPTPPTAARNGAGPPPPPPPSVARKVYAIKQIAAGTHLSVVVRGSRPTASPEVRATASSIDGLSDPSLLAEGGALSLLERTSTSLLQNSPVSPSLLHVFRARQDAVAAARSDGDAAAVARERRRRAALANEQRAAAALVPQISSGSFSGGRVAFWDAGAWIRRIGVLTSTGLLELYKDLNSNAPERVVEIRGHDVEIQCKGCVLEAWRVRPPREFSLLARVRLNSRIEAVAWAQHLSKHANAEQHMLGGSAGLPVASSRRAAWRAAIGNPLRVTPELFMIYKERATRQEGIGLDVKRTLPSLLLFGKSGEPLYDQLREVLEVYTCYRPDVGYVQGMSYLAANLCLHMPNNAYELFLCLANLLASHHLFDFFRIGQAYDRVQRYYEVVDLILAKSSPRLWRHLCALGVINEVHVACFQWLQTCFVRRLPLEQATQLWDAFLCQGDTMVMMRACVGLLLCMEKSILAVGQPEDILMLLRSTRRMDDVVKKTFTAVQVPAHAQAKLDSLVANSKS
jgi:alpha-tubulin suppressor-like RCC1 family protein